MPKTADARRSAFSIHKNCLRKYSQRNWAYLAHLNKTKNEFKEVLLVDLQGDEYQVSLDDTEFVIQQKATFIKPTIKALMTAGQLQDAKLRISQIFELLKAVSQKGILDTDGALIHKNNIGFIKDKAIYIDTGKFVQKESIKTLDRFKADLRRLRPLHKWLVTRYPPLAAYFDKQQKKILDSFKEEIQ